MKRIILAITVLFFMTSLSCLRDFKEAKKEVEDELERKKKIPKSTLPNPPNRPNLPKNVNKTLIDKKQIKTKEQIKRLESISKMKKANLQENKLK